jgi:anti-sigma28 factor (negative regulator of flagellin synthesis)
MVGIQGLNGVPEPKSERPAKVRGERDASAREMSGANAETRTQDDLTISSEAQAAAEVARIIQLTKTLDEVRTDRVAAARESIERGDYKRPEVVAKVAERLMKFLD